MCALWQDLRYTFRQLRNAPVYALTAVLTLALGLGAATAMLAIVDSVLLRPVALPHAEQLVSFGTVIPDGQSPYFNYPDFDALRTRAHSLQAVAGWSSVPGPVTTPDGTRVGAVFQVEPGFFQVPNVPARLGRTLSAQDGYAPLAVVTDEFWQGRLGGSRHAVGSTIKVNNRLVTVAGILPPGFSFPYLAGEAVYLPFEPDEKREKDPTFSYLAITARLKPDATVSAAAAEARSVYAHAGLPSENNRGRLLVRTYRDSIVSNEQPALIALLGACAMLLLIACVNAANLQISRAVARMGEISLRAALGATRGRLLCQLMTESIVVSLLGAAVGLGLASAIISGVRTAYSHQFPRFDELALRPSMFLASVVLAVFTGVLAALAPAWSAMRAAGAVSAMQATRTTRKSRLSSGLIVAELALTCSLLVTAGLFLRTFLALEQMPLGFNPRHVTEMTLMPLNPKQSGPALKQMQTRLLARLTSLPGVQASAAQSSLPFSQFSLDMNTSFKITGRPYSKQDQTTLSLITAGYSEALHINPIQGRNLLPSDTLGAQPVCIANETFVRRYLAGKRVLGAHVDFTSDTKDGSDDRFLKYPVTVVGVIPDQISGRSLDEQPKPELFLPFEQVEAGNEVIPFLLGLAPQFAIRSPLSQAILERELRGALKEAAPDMAELQIGSMEANIAASLTRQRLALRLAGGFGLLALSLAGVGTYGVLASSVSQRTREIGIRMALGASRRRTVLLVLRQAGTMAALGLGTGLLCTWPTGRAIKAFLFGVTPLDPLTLLLVAFTLLIVCSLAAVVPAFRAASVDPVIALRSE